MRTAWETHKFAALRANLVFGTCVMLFAEVDTIALVPAIEAIGELNRALAAPRRQWRHARERVPFTMDGREDAEFKLYTRFKKNEFRQLLHELRLPARVKTTAGDIVDCDEALWIFLVRMSHPGTWHVLNPIMNHRDRRSCSRIFYVVLDHIYDNFVWTVEDINRWEAHMATFAGALSRKGCPYVTCMSFIDGTLSTMCRPRGGYSATHPDGVQRSVYSGHKKQHGLKYQGVVVPCGIMADCYGPVLGRRSDAYMLGESGFLERMRRLQANTGVAFISYGDAAFPQSAWIQRAFKGVNLTDQERQMNLEMRKHRIAIEWSFGGIEQQWGFLRYPKGMQLFKQPLAKIYMVAVVLTNCHCCCYGNVTNNYFDVAPPTLHDYLHARVMPPPA